MRVIGGGEEGRKVMMQMSVKLIIKEIKSRTRKCLVNGERVT